MPSLHPLLQGLSQAALQMRAGLQSAPGCPGEPPPQTHVVVVRIQFLEGCQSEAILSSPPAESIG